MNAVRSNNVSLKYQRFTSSGCKDIRITKIEFVQRLNSFNISFRYQFDFFPLKINTLVSDPCPLRSDVLLGVGWFGFAWSGLNPGFM